MDNGGVLLTEMKAHHCRFVLRGTRSPVLFCGEPTIGAGSWCLEHRRLVHASLSPKKRRGDDVTILAER
jgi:hypothetical protein